jgi:23S rRNA (cytidine1920-2'-O)/16S rRNA (cytidine1409-2'-O)-methyltransferase
VSGEPEGVAPAVAGNLRAVKKRLDVLLVERGLADSRAKAQALVLAGRVPGYSKAGSQVACDVPLEVSEVAPYVSRGGEKLAGALAAFDLEVNGLTCVDIGASTGGFTDCLLQAGAASVTAIDVGYGQLDSGLRNDSRVHTLERTNARRIDCDLLAAAPDVITCDVSFISFRLVVPPVVICARAGWRALILVKPQFEAGRADVGKGGVVRDPAIHQRVLVDACAWVEDQGWTILGLDVSDLVGAKGNREFFLLLSDGSVQSGLDVHKSIEMCVGS